MTTPARFAGEAVGDPLLELVADLDPDLALLEREHDQQAVVLALVADAAAVILEQLVGVLADVAVAVDVGTVATTTTSPLAALSARLMRSMAAAFSGSMTCAKSLTGSVSSGEGRRPRRWSGSSRTDDATRSRHAGQRRTRRATPRAICALRTLIRAEFPTIDPSIDVGDEPFDGVEIRREQPLGVGRRDLADAGERDDVRCGGAGQLEATLDVTRGRRDILACDAVEARDAREQRGEGRRRSTIRTASASPRPRVSR